MALSSRTERALELEDGLPGTARPAAAASPVVDVVGRAVVVALVAAFGRALLGPVAPVGPCPACKASPAPAAFAVGPYLAAVRSSVERVAALLKAKEEDPGPTPGRRVRPAPTGPAVINKAHRPTTTALREHLLLKPMELPPGRAPALAPGRRGSVGLRVRPRPREPERLMAAGPLAPAVAPTGLRAVRGGPTAGLVRRAPGATPVPRPVLTAPTRVALVRALLKRPAKPARPLLLRVARVAEPSRAVDVEVPPMSARAVVAWRASKVVDVALATRPPLIGARPLPRWAPPTGPRPEPVARLLARAPALDAANTPPGAATIKVDGPRKAPGVPTNTFKKR